MQYLFKNKMTQKEDKNNKWQMNRRSVLKGTPKVPGTASVHESSNMKLLRLCIHPFPTPL